MRENIFRSVRRAMVLAFFLAVVPGTGAVLSGAGTGTAGGPKTPALATDTPWG